MKERPIIFSSPMVRAILDGRKTQTRRIVKPAPGYIESSGRWTWPMPKRLRKRYPNCPQVLTASREWWQYLPAEAFPVQSGDVLWVRETCCIQKQITHVRRDGGGHIERRECFYRADGVELQAGLKWAPSIHMPRWASRLRLTVKSVRVERLRDITYQDCRAEGCIAPCERYSDDPNDESWFGVAAEFRDIWESIHGPGSWDVNPWVWVYEFERTP